MTNKIEMEDDLSSNEDSRSENESRVNIKNIKDVQTKQETQKPTQATLEMILDIPVDLEIELGRKRVLLEEVLKLETGSILSLDKTTDDPVELYINNTLIAAGMLISVDEEGTLGFQVRDIVTRTKRIRSVK